MSPLDSELRRALAERIRYYNELGIYDFYRRETQVSELPSLTPISQSEQPKEMTPRRSAVAVSTPPAESMLEKSFAKISATAPAASCISKGASRSFLA